MRFQAKSSYQNPRNPQGISGSRPSGLGLVGALRRNSYQRSKGNAMPEKSEKVLSFNSHWVTFSIAAVLVIAPIAAGSSAKAADFIFIQIDAPGATSTNIRGINDAGQIVGSFSDSTGTH